MWAVVDGGLEADALNVVVGEDGSDESKGRTYCRIKNTEESELLANNVGLKVGKNIFYKHIYHFLFNIFDIVQKFEITKFELLRKTSIKIFLTENITTLRAYFFLYILLIA